MTTFGGPFSQKGADYGEHWGANQALHGGPVIRTNLGPGRPAVAVAGRAALTGTRYPVEDAGIRAGEITAWRVWMFKQGHLYSTFMDTLWLPGKPLEGDVDNYEGVHAFKDREDAVAYAKTYACVLDAAAVGQVHLWGAVIEHRLGWRAQFAKIIAVEDVVCGDWYPRQRRGFFRLWEKRRQLSERLRLEICKRYGLPANAQT